MSSDSTRGDHPARVRRHPLPRGLAAAAGCLAFLLLTVFPAAPASAHDMSLPDAGHYRSTVTSITPAVQGLKVELTTGGETVTLTNHTGTTVTVLGYEGEDYLRLTPTGVDENTNSLSAFLNGSLVIQGLPQQLGQTSPSQPPSWKHVADVPVFSWHDHRVHWMAQQRPPVVAADPGVPHHVFDWAFQLRVGTEPVTVRGTLDWTGELRLSGWLLALVLLIGVAVVVCLVLLLRRVYLKSRRDMNAVGGGSAGGTRSAPPEEDELVPVESAPSRVPDR